MEQENNVEKEKNIEKGNSNGGLISLIVLLFLLVLGLGGYIVYDKVLSNKPSDGDNTNSNNSNNSTVTLKVDSNKDWIYDADYNLPTNKESYYALNDKSKLIKASDLVVPYININSSDAKKANQEIYKLYEQLINTFNKNLKEEIWFTTVEYSSNINNDILSVVIKTTSSGTAAPIYEYYTYTFNITNGNLLSYEDTYRLINIDSSNIKSIVKQKIAEELKDYPQPFYDEALTGSVNNYDTSVSEKTIKYYLDANGKLNIIVKIYGDYSQRDQIVIILG